MVNITSNLVPQASKRLKAPQVKTLIFVIIRGTVGRVRALSHLEIRERDSHFGGHLRANSRKFPTLASRSNPKGEEISRTKTGVKAADALRGFTWAMEITLGSLAYTFFLFPSLSCFNMQ